MSAYYTESQIASPEGLSLFLRHWTPQRGQIKAQLLVLPGYGEHGGRYRELAHCLAMSGIAVSAVDLRGHGRSEGRRGHVDRFDHYLDDTQAALGTLDHKRRFILGHSNGGLVALDFVVSRRPPIAGVIVTNPFLRLALEPSPIARVLGELAGAYRPSLSLPITFKPEWLSSDPEIVDAYRRDPLVFRAIGAAWFREVTAAQRRAHEFRRVEVPLLYVYGDSDPVASPMASRALACQLHSQDKTVVVREGGLHEVLNERDRASLQAQIGEWILARTTSRRARKS